MADPKEAKPEKGEKAEKADKSEKSEKAEKAAPKVEKSDNPDFKYIVRLADTDLDGKYQVEPALARVKGIGMRLAALVAERAQVPRYQKIGDCTDAQVESLAQQIDRIAEMTPVWMVNRPRDLDTGDNLHVIGADLEGKHRDDINRLKKIRAYRGVRHEAGQKVRGQRTRSNGRTGLAVGVIKKKEGAPGSGGEEKKE
jgi:small subunit ribosomal protein S13